ncbi:MAG: TRAP transporter small permease subunit [Hyphomicrobiaceae bacterium]|nr:TRAP transporter small permease subunit [Hyphomicrobiaceae bacterium]
MRDLLEQFLKLMEMICLTICNVLLALMVVGGMVNILVRDLLGQGIVWVFQTSIIFFAWSIFFGIFVVYRRGADVSVELIVDLFSPPLQQLVRWFTCGLTILLFGTILLQAPKLISLQSIPLETIDFPRYIISLPLFFSAVLVIISSLNTAIAPLHKATSAMPHEMGDDEK